MKKFKYTIKPLAWHETTRDWCAGSELASYQIEKRTDEDGAHAIYVRTIHEQHPWPSEAGSIEAAKKFCEEDHKERVEELLEPCGE